MVNKITKTATRCRQCKQVSLLPSYQVVFASEKLIHYNVAIGIIINLVEPHWYNNDMQMTDIEKDLESDATAHIELASEELPRNGFN